MNGPKTSRNNVVSTQTSYRENGSASAESLDKKRPHPHAGDVAEWRQVERIVSAVQFERLRLTAILPQRSQHVGGKLRQKRRVVFAVHQEAVFSCPHPALDVRHWTDRRPEFAQLLHFHAGPQPLPHMTRRHARLDDIGEVRRNMKEAARAYRWVMHHRDIADGRPDACPENPEPRVALLLQPAQALPRISHGLLICLERKADVRADELVSTFVARGHAAVVVGHAYAQHGDAEQLEPLAQPPLPVPLRIPVGKNDNRRAGPARREILRMHRVVLWPRRAHGTGERKNGFAVKLVIVRRSGRVPLAAVFDGSLRPSVQEAARFGVVRVTANVLQAPCERAHLAIIVRCPAADFVTAYFLFEPAHRRQIFQYSEA